MSRAPRVGGLQKKLLLLLEAGVALALSASPRRSFRVLSATSREFQRLNRESLAESIRRLYQSQLVDARDHPDGHTELILSTEGRKRALKYRLDGMEIPRPKKWDRKWRVVVFDIPEEHRQARDALRDQLKRMGCYEFQKSVFVHPFECRDQIDFVIEMYQIRPFVRFIIATDVDNALHLKTLFRI